MSFSNLTAQSVAVAPSRLNVVSQRFNQSGASTIARVASPAGSPIVTTLVTNNSATPLYMKFGADHASLGASSTDYDILVPPMSVGEIPPSNMALAIVFGNTGSGHAVIADFVAA